MFKSAKPIFDIDSTILVTGVTGFIGSHIADKLLEAGYLVHGITRDSDKNGWLRSHFDEKYGRDTFKLFQVSDLICDEDLDEPMHGVSGVIHAAADLSFSPDPNVVIPPTIHTTLAVLKAAARSPSVKRFVLTSSCAAATSPQVGRYPTVTSESWNDEAIQQAWADPPYTSDRGFAVYAASKTVAEKESWAWVAKTRPAFTLNTVLPAANFGKSLDVTHQGHPSTSGLVEALYLGNHKVVMTGAEYFYVDVEDTARLHLAALLHPEIESRRIFAYAEPYTWKMIQDILRSAYPDRTFEPDMPDHALDRSIIAELLLSLQLLKDMGRGDWSSLEDSVRKNTADLYSSIATTAR